MNLDDRMIIDLLNHYAFLLHEDVTKVTDEEIEVARDFAHKYLEKEYKYKSYDHKFKTFVNMQKFKGLTSKEYKLCEKDLYKKILQVNNLFNVYHWKFNIYHNTDYNDYLLLGVMDEKSQFERITLKYDIRTGAISKCDMDMSDDMMELGNIYYNYYSYDELNDIKI